MPETKSVTAGAYVMGVDYGTDSVRTILVNAANGEEVSSSVFYYPRWKEGKYCNAAVNQFRQHPLDYIEGLEATIKDCLQKAGSEVANKVKAVSVDTTGSTPVAVDETGTPLALRPEFKENPNAMFVLWKDHTAVKEAKPQKSTKHAKKFGHELPPVRRWHLLIRMVLGQAAAHTLREDEAGAPKPCYSWVEHCDWIPFLLTGGKRCSRT